ncbi:helicase [soil metagenome]
MKIQVAEELAKLKDFQRRTVDHVFQRMYTDPNPTQRFLVADEVGLGKTMVARGFIARAIAHRKKEVKRVDVVYVCSNASIAQQNIAKLNVLGDQEIAFTTRLTLLPAKVHELAKNQVNFVSFTPAVAFNVKQRGGTKEERVVLFALLDQWATRSSTALRNMLRASASTEGWDRSLNESRLTLDESLKQAFLERLRADTSLTARLDASLERFARARKDVPNEDNEERLGVIGELRHLLAKTCIVALEPDIVILDEFQRFSDILDGEDETAEIARLLFDYPEVRVLLLSATPYRMLSLRNEAEDHFSDFLKTAQFLLRDASKVQALRTALADLRDGLSARTSDGHARAADARLRAEGILRLVMTRMERVGNTAERDALVVERPQATVVAREDLPDAMLTERLARAAGVPSGVEYWKSAPYVLSFMRDYELKQKVRDATGQDAKRLANVLNANAGGRLAKKAVEQYEPIPLANGRLRALAADTLDRSMWKLLWLPPSLSYIEREGPWAEAFDCTKALVFTSWNLAPDAIAALLSYEAERRMIGDTTGRRYSDDARPLLTFRLDEGRPAGMTSLLLQYPSPLLAQHFDPLRFALDLGEGRPVPLADIRAAMRPKLERLLRELPRGGEQPDPRWYWAAPVRLDARFPQMLPWIERGFAAIYDRDEDDPDAHGESGFEAHVEEMAKCMRGELSLGAFPHDLVDVLTDLAIGSPAVCAARALQRLVPELTRSERDNVAVLTSAARVAGGFRSLFNVPESMALIRAQSGSEVPYWREVLRYAAAGDLQAVLDEYAHYLRDDTGLFSRDDDERKIEAVASAMAEAMTLRTATLQVDEVGATTDAPTFDEMRLRARFAVRYGNVRDAESRSVDRASDVRKSFNSPFRPFVLASTSVGQEGLDFHPYCHAVVHWNLPTNPVDLEQREGRVHRYKGHAIRKNVARAHGLASLVERWDDGDPWECMFDLAKRGRSAEQSDLYPYWLFDTPGGAKVERRIPMLPLSREHEQLRRLKKSLALYRLTFGQPRQEDLLAWLEREADDGSLTPAQIADLRIRLEPDRDPIPPNEDTTPSPDAEAISFVRPGGVEAALRKWVADGAARIAVAKMFVAALDEIPNATTSRHWTLNHNRTCLRLNLGVAEVVTVHDDGRLEMIVDGLTRAELGEIRSADGVPGGVPYDRLRRLSPRAKWVEVSAGLVPGLFPILSRGLGAFVALDRRTTDSPWRKLLSLDAVQTVGKLAGAPGWSAWKPLPT